MPSPFSFLNTKIVGSLKSVAMTYHKHIAAIALIGAICVGIAVPLMLFHRRLGEAFAIAQVAPPIAPPTPPKKTTAPEPLPRQSMCTGPRGEWHTFPLRLVDETVDGEQTIRDALIVAGKENKRVLVMWCENMGQFGLFLEDVLANDAACRPLVESAYVWVRVDLGRGYARGDIKHHELAKSFGMTHLQTPCPNGKTMGAPALCIIDPETGKTVGQLDPSRDLLTGVMGGNDMAARPMTVQRLFDEKIISRYLLDHRPPATQK